MRWGCVVAGSHLAGVRLRNRSMRVDCAASNDTRRSTRRWASRLCIGASQPSSSSLESPLMSVKWDMVVVDGRRESWSPPALDASRWRGNALAGRGRSLSAPVWGWPR